MWRRDLDVYIREGQKDKRFIPSSPNGWSVFFPQREPIAKDESQASHQIRSRICILRASPGFAVPPTVCTLGLTPGGCGLKWRGIQSLRRGRSAAPEPGVAQAEGCRPAFGPCGREGWQRRQSLCDWAAWTNTSHCSILCVEVRQGHPFPPRLLVSESSFNVSLMAKLQEFHSLLNSLLVSPSVPCIFMQLIKDFSSLR